MSHDTQILSFRLSTLLDDKQFNLFIQRLKRFNNTPQYPQQVYNNNNIYIYSANFINYCKTIMGEHFYLISHLLEKCVYKYKNYYYYVIVIFIKCTNIIGFS